MSKNHIKAVLHLQNRHSYLNAIDYLNLKGLNKEDVFFIKMGDFKVEADWPNIYDFCEKVSPLFSLLSKKSSYIKKILQVYHAKRAASTINNLLPSKVYFITAHYAAEPVMISYTKLLSEKTMVIVDDGMKVFKTVEVRNTSYLPNIDFVPIVFKISFLKYMTYKFILRLLNSRMVEPSSVLFYSRFPIGSRVAKSDRFIAQDPLNLHKLPIMKTKLHFLSQPLVTLGIVDEKQFKKMLRTVVDCFGDDYDLLYFPHRKESAKELSVVGEIQEFVIVQNTLAYEEYITNEDMLPRIIVTFYSSVIYTVYSALPRLKIYYIRFTADDSLASPFQKDIEHVYEALESDQGLRELR